MPETINHYKLTISIIPDTHKITKRYYGKYIQISQIILYTVHTLWVKNYNVS